MDSLGENEFCETNVKEGAKRTNESLSFLFGHELKNSLNFMSIRIFYSLAINRIIRPIRCVYPIKTSTEV